MQPNNNAPFSKKIFTDFSFSLLIPIKISICIYQIQAFPNKDFRVLTLFLLWTVLHYSIELVKLEVLFCVFE